ncbi:hypothetical protein [Spirosoma flavus]
MIHVLLHEPLQWLRPEATYLLDKLPTFWLNNVVALRCLDGCDEYYGTRLSA